MSKRTEERTETHACDYISRQAAIEAIGKNLHKGTDLLTDTFVAGIEQVLEALPSAQQERKTGKWIPHYLKTWRDAPWGHDCSECGAWFVVGKETIKKYNYCPNCGAGMETWKDTDE